SGPLFFVFLGHALRLLVRDALVAIDAGHVVFAGHFVLLAGALFLAGGVHALQAVAVAAFARVVGLHARPFVARQLQALGLELLRRVDGAHQLAPQFARGLDLAHHLVGP